MNGRKPACCEPWGAPHVPFLLQILHLIFLLALPVGLLHLLTVLLFLRPLSVLMLVETLLFGLTVVF